MSLSIMIKETMDATLSRFGAEIAEKVVNICADKFGFSADEALSDLGGVLLFRLAKEPKQRREKIEKPSFPLPYSGELNANLCQALRQNVGLYTQCQSAKKMGKFCKQCHVLSTKSETGIPEYGLIEARKAAYDAGEEYTDPKGRKPVHYTRVMRKYKLTDAQVAAEIEKFGIGLDASHLVVPASEGRRGRPAAKAKEPKEAKGKGRPKKEKKVIQIEGDDDDDLFASLVASANADDNEELVKTSEEKAEKEAKRLQEKAEREAKLAAEKAEKEAKRAAEKEARELKLAQEKAEKDAREAKRLQEKADREAKLAQEKAEREAKEAKRLQEKAEKEAKLAAEKAEKEAKKKAEKEAKKSTPSKKQEVDEDEEPEVVKKIVFNDKKYLVSKKSGVVYDYDKYVKDQEQVVVGKWDDPNKKVIFSSLEESEDEYESDEDDEMLLVGGGVSS